MEPNRIGRVLGIGARVAGAKLREQADRVGSVPAEKAGARVGAGVRQAARNFQAAQARAGNGAATAAAGTQRVARGAARFGGALMRPFAHATSILWNEIAGIFFALFAVFFLEHTWMVYRKTQWQDRHVFLYGGLALAFVWFAGSSFWRVRRRQRG
jgi:hypothetical protein